MAVLSLVTHEHSSRVCVTRTVIWHPRMRGDVYRFLVSFYGHWEDIDSGMYMGNIASDDGNAVPDSNVAPDSAGKNQKAKQFDWLTTGMHFEDNMVHDDDQILYSCQITKSVREVSRKEKLE